MLGKVLSGLKQEKGDYHLSGARRLRRKPHRLVGSGNDAFRAVLVYIG